MTDRRTRPIVRCAEPGCPHAGPWQGSRGYCPGHYRALLESLRATIALRRNPDPGDPL